jgi:hypothetical protein
MPSSKCKAVVLRYLRAEARNIDDVVRGGRQDRSDTMPAKSEKQRKFMGAELQRKREGKKTRTDMSEKELEKYASKSDKKKD